jgi:D-alanyl-D-alanine carboxypeptidase
MLEERRPAIGAAIAGALAAALALLPAGAALAGPTLLFDIKDGTVLYAEDPDNQWHPASLTKIMTAYVVFEAIKDGTVTLQSKVSCSQLANSQPPSKIGMPVGAELTVEKALQALVVKSANDVAVMLAEAVAGSQDAFVERMNATAKRLGMTRTNFVNANGLPAPEQVTTARDLARLATAVVRDFPNYAGLWSMVDVQIGKRHLRTHNALLNNYDGADGFKTGFTCDSGFNVVASATRDGRKLVAVVLGEPTGSERTLRAASLLEHGFATQGWKALFGDAKTIETLPLAPDAKGPMTMRQTVVSYECGTGHRPVAKKHRKVAGKVHAGEKAASKAAGAPTKPAKKNQKSAQTGAARSQP